MSSEPMTAPAISVHGISKRYQLGERAGYRRLSEVLQATVLRPFRSKAARKREVLWAIRDVTFEVPSGEILGIIGANGAGKSTLLKILARITRPTEGRAEIYGRVGSLLEVGTGFHPELTGRENVFLNGAILGMRRKEIVDKYDEIVAFSDIERFMDTPVKHYSSGMRVRLAFSVAAHLEPEILFVDEVLSVGDAAFQAKSLGKMQDVASGGRTVLFVSHNMRTIMSLCNRVIWMKDGGIHMDGDTTEVVEAYMSEGSMSEARWENEDAARPDAKLRITSVEVGTTGSSPQASIRFIDPIVVGIEHDVSGPVDRTSFTVEVTDPSGMIALSTSSDDAGELEQSWEPGRHRQTFEIPAALLRPGRYFLTVKARTFREKLAEHENCLTFDILPIRENGNPRFRYGVVTPVLHWASERSEVTP